MSHPTFRVRSFEITGPYTLKVAFDDCSLRSINFEGVLAGQLFGPLRELSLFNQVRLDPEVHTLVWPNGADFDPAMLHDWPQHEPALAALTATWSEARPAELQANADQK